MFRANSFVVSSQQTGELFAIPYPLCGYRLCFLRVRIQRNPPECLQCSLSALAGSNTSLHLTITCLHFQDCRFPVTWQSSIITDGKDQVHRYFQCPSYIGFPGERIGKTRHFNIFPRKHKPNLFEFAYYAYINLFGTCAGMH